MAVTFVGAGALATNNTVATQAIACHASTAVGDILIAQVQNKSVTANAITPPDGTWTSVIATEITDCTLAAHDHQFSLYWKRATAAGAQSFTFTKATDDNVFFGGVISSWRDCLASGSPIDATAPARTKTTSADDLVYFPAFDPTLPSHVVYMIWYGLVATAPAAAMSSDVDPDCTTRYTTAGSFACTSGDSSGAAIAARTWATNSATNAGSTGVVFALTPEPLACLANDVLSNSTVSNPAAAQIGGPVEQALLANDVISTSVVTNPAVHQLHGVLANDVISTSDVPTPTVGLIGVLVNPFAENVVSTPILTNPAVHQLHGILANNVVSTSDERLVAPATNGFYPVAFYGRAFDHSPITNVLAVTDTVDVLASVVVTNFGLNANDVISTSDVPTPAAGIIRVCLANDVISTSDVPTPAAVITRVILANDVISTSDVPTPAVKTLHGLLANDVISTSDVPTPAAVISRNVLANDVISTSDVPTPALGQLRVLLANDVISTSDVPTPAAIIRRDALANDVISNSSVSQPSQLKQLHGLFAENVVSGSSVSQQNVFTSYVLFAEDVRSVPAVSRPTQLAQRQVILANDIVSASDERLVAPATNGFYPAAFYGKAFDHLPAVNALAAVDTADVLASVVVGRFDLNANDVISTSDVPTPAAVVIRNTLANDVKSNSSVTQPAAVIQRGLLANDVISTSDVPTPAASITRNALANDVISTSKVTNPLVGIIGVTSGRHLVSASSVSQPAINQTYGAFSAEDVISASSVSQPSQLQRQTLLANDVVSAPFVRLVAPATNGFYPTAFYGVAFDHLPAANVLAAVDTADVLASVSIVRSDVAASYVVSASSVSQPSLLRAQAFAAEDVISASLVSQPLQLQQLQTFAANDVVSAPFVRLVAPATNGFYPAAFYGVAFDHLPVTNALVTTEVTDVLVSVALTAVGGSASNVISPSSVSQPSQLQQLQMLLANDVVSAPSLRLVAPATNGFYPAAFYGVAFDHLPAANVLAAVEDADVLAVAAAVATAGSGAWDIISASSVSQPTLYIEQALNVNDVISTSSTRVVEPATNGFYPAAFYGVAFDHLPATNVLAAAEDADVLAVVALTAVGAVTRGVISASSVSQPSQLQQHQVLNANNIVSTPFVRLVEPATNGFYPAAFYGVAFDHLPITNALAAAEAVVDALAIDATVLGVPATCDLAVVETADALVIGAGILEVAAACDLAAVEAADALAVDAEIAGIIVATVALLEPSDTVSFSAALLDKILLDFNAYENADAFAAKVGRWDFSYGEDEGIRVAWEEQVVAVGAKTPEDADAPTVDVWIGFYGLAFDQYGFFSGYGGFLYDATDADLIHVAWEEQELVALGRPRNPTVKYHPPSIAFDPKGFDNRAFFMDIRGRDYDDDEAIVVPPSYVIERLRETSKSYVAPRRKV